MTLLAFLLRQSWRETRAAPRRFAYFLLCIALGVAGLVGVKGFATSLSAALLREARTLMAADLQVSTVRPASAEQVAILDDLRRRGAAVTLKTELLSMAAAGPAAPLLVEVKAVEPDQYPFYGEVELAPAAALFQALSGDTALVAPELLERMGLAVGDALHLGNATFRIAGTITREPDRVVSAFSLGPRVMITQEALGSTGLIAPGSRVSYAYLVGLPAGGTAAGPVDALGLEEARAALQAAFNGDGARVTDFRQAQPQVRRMLDRLLSFLGLVTVITLLVGGLGVASSTRVYIEQKLDDIAVLKCLGGTSRLIGGIYLTQAVLLGLLGSLLGVGLGAAVQALLPGLIGPLVRLDVHLALAPLAALHGLGIGVVTAFLFTLLPLTRVARVRPALVLRRHLPEERGAHRMTPLQGVTAAAIALLFGGVALWQGGSWRSAVWLLVGLAGVVAVLAAAAWLTLGLLRALPAPAGLAIRHGLRNLYRPGSQTSAVVIALGVGVAVILSIYLVQGALTRQVAGSVPEGAPNLFFLNLQGDQAAPFHDFLRARAGVGDAPAPLPMIAGRLKQVDGRSLSDLELSPADRRAYDREFRLTSAAEPPAGDVLLDGGWWPPGEAPALVSAEDLAARALGIRVGSRLEFDFAGIPRTLEVANIRRVEWMQAGTNFTFVLSPAAAAGLPTTYLGLARVDAGAEGALQRAVVERFPAVTVLNLADILRTVQDVMDRIGLVVRFVAAFSIAAGLLIMVSALAVTRYRRLREAAILKTLGALSGTVARIFAVEYLTLGLVAGGVGALLANLLTWLLLSRVLETAYQVDWAATGAGLVLTAALTVATGFASTAGILRQKPLVVLREE